ncbi:replication endonuclease [Cellvibrio sp. OA-2007]|uniref:replication endonuclease n=1 Tax=Cellvibrio sp. OA-2007 TaxID=529823 RepID=UPI00078334D9|nr:replication endonuclease [Cellvibrio sp. OA-2007]
MVSPHTMPGQFIGFDGQQHQFSVLDQFGTVDCAKFRRQIFDRVGPLQSAAAASYLHAAQKNGHVAANSFLRNLDQKLSISESSFSLLSADGYRDVCDYASEVALACDWIRNSISDSSQLDYEETFQHLVLFIARFQIDPPSVRPDRSDLPAAINRLCCPLWWRRQLRKMQADRIESVARDLRQVHAKNSQYCSHVSTANCRVRKHANRNYLESKIAVNELDQEFTLSELSDLGVSNPAIRRYELITRVKGFESVSKLLGHEGVFITLTTPSKFHRMTKITVSDGKAVVVPNKAYAGLTPRDAQEYLSGLWAKMQAKFSRLQIKPYGFRIAEPHHDGTPHWHFLLFSSSENLQIISEVFHHYALQDSPSEKGARERRLKIEKIKQGINNKTGREYSAIGYLIKYICKNIDGYGVDNKNVHGGQDWANKNASDIAEKIEAWSRTHRIRQFQQIGGASVTVWRELRRLSEQDGELEALRQAAADGNWDQFVLLMGGPTVRRDEQTVRPSYAASQQIDKTSGVIVPATKTRYGDEAKERVVGVLYAGLTVLSRIHTWDVRDNEKLRLARQKIMDGIVEIVTEISEQNSHLYPAHIMSSFKSNSIPLGAPR